MKFFNAFQITLLYAASPFAIQWLSTATFPASTAAFIMSIVFYLIGTWFMTCSVCDSL